MSGRDWVQLAIVHLSDIHFGKPHRFQPDISPAGADAGENGYPELAAHLVKDASRRLVELHVEDPAKNGGQPGLKALRGRNGKGRFKPVRVVFAISGDLTETAAPNEFDKARAMMQVIRSAGLRDEALDGDDIFIVPGNHDLVYDADSMAERWTSFCTFYAEQVADSVTKRPAAPIRPERPQQLSRLIDQSDAGLVVAEINSAAFVRKGTPEEKRGFVDEGSLAHLEQQLEAVDPASLARSVRLAIIHHHPIIVPALAEPELGYDAVVNAAPLLGLLKRHGFQLVLHGHKHDAQTFPHDSVSAWSGTGSRPMMVVSGGSAGSRHLPEGRGARNTYNIISVKWHPASSQARVRVETRGLVMEGSDNEKLLPHRWHWKGLRVDDRLLRPSGPTVPSKPSLRVRTSVETALLGSRDHEIERLRRCFPCVEVAPSFSSQQGFEARVWLDGQVDKPGYVPPVRVVWDAGRYFPFVAEVQAAHDPTFSARFSYYGPALIQACIYWGDGHSEVAHIFAHYPGAGPGIVITPPG